MTPVNALLICAHPDDETIFFGGSLLFFRKYRWKLLCVTYKKEDNRAKECINAISQYRANGIDIDYEFLGHPDLRNHSYGGIDLSTLYQQLNLYSSWANFILSHNENGEYGHPAHIATNNVVRSVYGEAWYPYIKDNHNFKTMQSSCVLEVPLSKDIIREKLRIFKTCYPSQQVLWSKAPHIVEWAFSRGVELLGKG